MDDATREQLSFVFAKLTGNLEDAASLALKGQRPQISAEEAEELIRSIQALLNHADARIRAIERLTGRNR
ncbi:hypothetical protein [Ruegeria sp. Ofav3-42]|uniref:hypothetical protein n=1 Tax=Ruegeria sp. Ofav3-42 TaxID=2917759 RepID=UPI001EF62AE6|nr:hypothetical protein [Ruegeria sp. Ofav3-42]MCG7519495.1 hypothetical protein [Ruegeria sp. Ofav3-42]